MIAVVNTDLGNLNSVLFALERRGLRYELTSDAQKIQSAEQVILPGVGHAAAGMKRVKELGLFDTLKNLKQPTLGICLGMQLLFEWSEEGQVDCLGIIPGKVQALKVDPKHPVPHMGWNQLTWRNKNDFTQWKDSFFYFVHSYAVSVNEYTVASCDYTKEFSAIVQKDNFVGIQFHPEKSGVDGEELLSYFLEQK